MFIPHVAKCSACGTVITIKIAQKPTILNLETVALVTLEHSGQVACPGCGIVLAPAIAGVAGLAITMAPVAAQKQNLVVMPGSSLPV